MFPTDGNPSILGSMNSATKSARTYPFMEVRGMYLISKAPRIVPHLAILPALSALQSMVLSGSWVKTTIVCAWK